jgi:transcriptional regulator with XRE-family HTH domain
MHIAHPQPQLFLTVEDLAKKVGLKRRQIAELARREKIPGVSRLDGYHYVYPITPELLDWIEWKRRQVQQRKQPKSSKTKTNVGVITIHGIRQSFDIWKRRVGGLDGILEMDRECQEGILVELQAFARLHHNIYRALNSN